MTSTRFYLAILLGFVLVLLAGEAVFQALPVYSGGRMQSTGPATPFARYVPGQHITYSFGWAFGNAHRSTISPDGYNNSAPFQEQAKVLLIGDSYIESLMLDYDQTVQGRLAQAIGGGVVAASASGNGLADSLQIARYYLPRIHPKNVVMFVETGDIAGLLDPPQRGHSGFIVEPGGVRLEHSAYAESRLKELVLHSALARYMYYNLKFPEWVGGKLAEHAVTPLPTEIRKAARARAMHFYLDELVRLGKVYGVKFTFLLDADRKVIYSGDSGGARSWHGDDRAFILAAARERGFDVADMEPVFARDWASRRQRLDFLPMDGHWNPVAHQLAAQALLPLLAPEAPNHEVRSKK